MSRATFGGWVTRAAEASLAAYAQSGLDFVVIDCQHSAIDEARAARAIARISAGTRRQQIFVRVSRNDAALIGRVADAGADGVIVPAVDDPEGAAHAVGATTYPPAGSRSYGPFGAGLDRDPAALAARVRVLAMIETESGYENAAAISATPGLAGIYVGPADLSLALGLDPREAFAPGPIDEPLGRLASLCVEAGVRAGIHAGTGGARRAIEAGYGFVTVGDLPSLVAAGVRGELADVA